MFLTVLLWISLTHIKHRQRSKSGKLLFNHPQGTHDDRFWALALAVYAAEKEAPSPAKPKAYTA